jgi:putative ABC transport system substrate-binding protein
MQFGQLKRREFIRLVGGTAATWPLAARAQMRRLATIGFLGSYTPSTQRNWNAAFVKRLQELGWSDHNNVVIEFRWSDGDADRAAEIAAEFVRMKVDVLVTSGTAPGLALKNATSTIPIVVATMGDPPASLPTSRGRAATSPDCRSSKRSSVPNVSICCGKWCPG